MSVFSKEGTEDRNAGTGTSKRGLVPELEEVSVGEAGPLVAGRLQDSRIQSAQRLARGFDQMHGWLGRSDGRVPQQPQQCANPFLQAPARSVECEAGMAAES